MQQRSIPAILEEIGALLEIEGENPFKVKAYYSAAKILASTDDLDLLIHEGRLKEIKGIGDALAAKITEYAETGKIAYYEELKQKIPVSLLELLHVPNLGPQKIRVLYEQLGVTNLGELEYACQENRLVNLPRFGEKTQQKIMKGIDFFKRHRGEFLFGEIYPTAMRIKQSLEEAVPEGIVEVCGSIRRRKEIVKDIDILVASKNGLVVSAAFTSLPEIDEVLLEGETKTSCRLTSGINADLRVVDPASFPCALVYFTGNKEHNVRLRGIAKSLSLKLNEYGLFDGDAALPVADEADLYRHLGLSYICPELREDMGEIEAAASQSLPQLVELSDLKGTLHVHTNLSDGIDDLEAIAAAARQLGLSYVGICDHSKSAFYAGGLKADQVRSQWEAIDHFNQENSDVVFLKGIESDILVDGSLDYDSDVLSGFDFVVASVHSSFSMAKPDMEARIIKAMANPFTTILGHPTGRLLLARDGFDIDMRTIIDAAAEYGVILELNASPYRLDTDWRHLIHAKQKGVMISIDPDAHSAKGLHDVFYGVGIARKGWLEPRNVVNTMNVNEIKTLFGKIRYEKEH
jgi:DNA polymerase (family 10)